MFGGERGDGAGRWGEGEREIMGRPVWGRGGRGVRADDGHPHKATQPKAEQGNNRCEARRLSAVCPDDRGTHETAAGSLNSSYMLAFIMESVMSSRIQVKNLSVIILNLKE